MTNVPCNGCTACCQSDVIILTGEDDASKFETVEWYGQLILKQKPNGDCIYLDRATGCTIHGRQPVKCQRFDCRVLIDGYSRKQRRMLLKRGLLTNRIVKAAHARIRRGRD